MTGNKLRDAAVFLFGRRGWTTDLAAALGRDRTTIYRYVQERLPIPGPVDAAVSAWLREFRATGKLPLAVRKAIAPRDLVL